MNDALRLGDYADRWGFAPIERAYVESLARLYGPDPTEGLLLIDRLFTKYPRPESVREAIRAVWEFRGRTMKTLRVSPDALEAAVRFVVCSADSGAGLPVRKAVLQQYLSRWGLDDQAALARAESELLRVAGADVSDEEVVQHFMVARLAYMTALQKRADTAEAREWLETNPNPLGFATNRFDRPGLARAFVEALYRAGAERVMIANISYDQERTEGGPTADTMEIDLPHDPESRARVFDVVNSVGRPEGGPLRDDGGKTVELGWD